MDLYKIYTRAGEFIIQTEKTEAGLKKELTLEKKGIIEGQEFKEKGIDPQNYSYRRQGHITLKTENIIGFKYYKSVEHALYDEEK